MLYERCQLFGSLPEGGGVLDQDEWLLTLMETCVTAARLGRKIDIKNPAHRDFYRWLFPKE